MNSVVKSLALPGLSLIWLFSHAAEAQTNRDTIVVSTGFGSTLSQDSAWGRVNYLYLWSGIVAGRPGQWRPYASVSVPIHSVYSDSRLDFEGNRSGRHELRAINLGATYSINASLTGYLGGGWTERRGRPPLRQFETSFESFRDDSLNVTAGLLIHTGQHVGINAAVGANPGTASLSVNLRF